MSADAAVVFPDGRLTRPGLAATARRLWPGAAATEPEPAAAGVTEAPRLRATTMTR